MSSTLTTEQGVERKGHRASKELAGWQGFSPPGHWPVWALPGRVETQGRSLSGHLPPPAQFLATPIRPSPHPLEKRYHLSSGLPPHSTLGHLCPGSPCPSHLPSLITSRLLTLLTDSCPQACAESRPPGWGLLQTCPPCSSHRKILGTQVPPRTPCPTSTYSTVCWHS